MKASEKKRRIEQEKKRETVVGLAIFLILLVVIVGAAWYFISPSQPPSQKPTASPTAIPNPTLTTCIEEGSLAMHIHVKLSILVNGQSVPIPANIGVSQSCTRPVHTHDGSGEIHIESPVIYAFTLNDFFTVWGQPFDNTQILQYKIDSAHTIRMTVNGVTNTQFQNYVLQDGAQIEITYGPF